MEGVFPQELVSLHVGLVTPVIQPCPCPCLWAHQMGRGDLEPESSTGVEILRLWYQRFKSNSSTQHHHSCPQTPTLSHTSEGMGMEAAIGLDFDSSLVSLFLKPLWRVHEQGICTVLGFHISCCVTLNDWFTSLSSVFCDQIVNVAASLWGQACQVQYC
jgi:hypothetical protein